MEDYSAIIRSVFEFGSIRDANVLFESCVKNAFPTFRFRGLELIRFLKDKPYMEGKSWNHVFEIYKSEHKGTPVWEVYCRRVTMGKTPDKHVLLDYTSLGFLDYIEE